MNKILVSSSHNEPDTKLVGAWSTLNGGRTIHLTITKDTPITEFEFEEMVEMISNDLRKGYLEQRFRPRKKKTLE